MVKVKAYSFSDIQFWPIPSIRRSVGNFTTGWKSRSKIERDRQNMIGFHLCGSMERCHVELDSNRFHPCHWLLQIPHVLVTSWASRRAAQVNPGSRAGRDRAAEEWGSAAKDTGGVSEGLRESLDSLDGHPKKRWKKHWGIQSQWFMVKKHWGIQTMVIFPCANHGLWATTSQMSLVMFSW